MNRIRRLLVALVLATAFLAVSVAAASAGTLATVLTNDTTLPHQQLPEGVPCWYDWSGCDVVNGKTLPGPVVHDGIDRHGYHYANPYGLVYNAKTGNPAPLDRVQITDLQEWYLSRSKFKWLPLYSTPPSIGGAMFHENFQGSPICGRYDPNTFPGSILVSPNVACGGVQVGGYNWHFYPHVARAYIANPADIGAIAVEARVRLAPDNPASPAPNYVVDVGADWWGCSACGTNSGAMQGRFVTVGPGWRVVADTTLTPQEINGGIVPLPPFVGAPAELF